MNPLPRGKSSPSPYERVGQRTGIPSGRLRPSPANMGSYPVPIGLAANVFLIDVTVSDRFDRGRSPVGAAGNYFAWLLLDAFAASFRTRSISLVSRLNALRWCAACFRSP